MSRGLLGTSLLVLVVGSFDELAVDEGGTRADEGDQVGCIDHRAYFANRVDFQLPVGAFTLPGNGEHTLRVTFLGGTVPGVYRTSMRVVVGGRTLTVPITATVTQEGQPF